uniref:GNAT family N-acetyltransferase n=1 Tax=Polynucleobacter sp. TaxID=2029855 RepID=UPI004048C686
MQTSFKIDTYHSLDLNLKNIWCELHKNSDAYAFQTFEWIAHWINTVGKDHRIFKPFIVVVSDSNEVLALFPFMLRRSFGITILEFLGGEQCDYNAPLIRAQKISHVDFKKLWMSVLQSIPGHDIRYFKGIPKELKEHPNPFLSIAPSFIESRSFAATLPYSWEDFQERLPKRFQKDNARMIRRLSEIGTLRFMVAKTLSEFNELTKVALKQKECRYRETGARNILADVDTQTFYAQLIKSSSKDVNIHMSALMLNNEAIATHLGLYHNGRFYYLFPAYDEQKWGKFSPGRLLLENLIKWAISAKLDVFDFTVGAESYKDIWCNLEMPLYRIVEPVSYRGYVYKGFLELIEWVKKNYYARFLAMKILKKIYTIAHIFESR